jgi:shikimate dehydrogenase
VSTADDVNRTGSADRTRRLAVLGHPIAHSLSPAIHNAAFAHLGLEREWSYEAIELAPADFEPGTRALPAEGFVGANVTLPHKPAALALADDASARARKIGAANTLTFSSGSILADNTDAPGFLDALPIEPAGRAALVLGAGGSARAIVWALGGAGAEVAIWNRTTENARALALELGGEVIETGGRLPIGDYELIVNTTSVGLGGPSPSDLDDLNLGAEDLTAAHTVVDLVYGSSQTGLLSAADAAGAATVDGREILVRQGAESFRIWTGIEAPLDVMRGAAHR